MVKHILTTCILVVFSSFLMANSTSQRSNFRISELDNLPQKDVNRIFQDSRGFMWIGTLDGLHRYDGYDYKTYRISHDENSISSNMIIDIDEDNDGNLWVATYNKGLCKLDPFTETFTDFAAELISPKGESLLDVNRMLIDKNNVIWLNNRNNLYRVVMDKEMTEVLSVNEVLTSNSAIQSFLSDKNGQFWVGSSSELIRIPNPYDLKENITTERFSCPADYISLMGNDIVAGGSNIHLVRRNSTEIGREYVMELVYDKPASTLLAKDGKIWAGNRSGVMCLEESTDGTWQENQQLKDRVENPAIELNVVTTLSSDNMGNIWVGKRGGGVSIIDLKPQQFGHYRKTSNPSSISDNQTRCVYQDSYKNVWIGTESGGVNVLKAKNGFNFDNGFTAFSVNSNPRDNRVYAVQEMLTPASSKQKSIVWVGTSYPVGLVGVNPETLEIVYSDEISDEIGFVFAMETYANKLWVGTYGQGLWELTCDEDGKVVESKQFPVDMKAPEAISSFIIRSILRDRQGNIWIGTDKGLNLISEQELKKKTPHVQKFSQQGGHDDFLSDYILDIYEGDDGKLWFATMGGGLLSYTPTVHNRNVHFSITTIDDGLPSNTIKHILEDRDGNMWLSSNVGISKYNPYNQNVVNFDMNDGLQGNEFSEICGFKLADGRLIFGGNNGFNVFDPSDIHVDAVRPKLFITELSVDNETIKPSQDSEDDEAILVQSIEYTESIELSYDQNSFSISFAGLHYTAPNKNKYRYMLDGFDKEWITTSADFRKANYTNIPQGQYTFKVICSNSANLWTEEPVTLKVRVMPPLYFSMPAFALYLVLILLSVFLYLKTQRDRDEREKELLVARLEKDNVEEISQMRQRFFTNVSHEFKTPLTLIKGPIDRLLKVGDEMKDKEKKDNYMLIKQNVKILMRLISQLMDFQKLDQNKMGLRYNKVELNAFVGAIYKSFETWATKKSIKFTFTPLSSTLETVLDDEKIELIIYNVLSNAFKNTDRGGKISLELREVKADNIFSVVVADSGVGISDKDKPHIFERFFQSKEVSRKSYGGTGVGLAHSKALVELHNGSINFESEEGIGTTFFIHLPINKNLEVISREPEMTLSQDLEAEVNKDVNEIVEVEEKVEKKKHHYTVLVVEDNEDLRSFIANEFADTFNILQAGDGVEGFEMAEKHDPSLVLSDVMMPNMDGIEMCQKIKTTEGTSHIPIILLTSKTAEEDQIEGFNMGADGYVAKPFSTDVLRHRMLSLLENREKLQGRFQKEIEINPMIISNTPADTKFMNKVLELIEANLSDSDFNVEKLAQAYGVSRVYLNKKIKALTGESTMQFQRSIKLKHAASLLTQNVLSVSEVAWEVGYNDLNTFRQRFKEMFSISPSEYRATHLEAPKEDEKPTEVEE